MANYYFSSSSGNNSTGDGSIGNPWQNFYGKKDGTSALSGDDFCYFKAGDTWVNQSLIVDSNGTAGHPITIDRYGVGADPIFNWGSVVTGWTYTGANNIYKKSGLIIYGCTVGVDGTSALCNWTGSNTTLVAGTYRNESGTIYIRLADNSNPSGHTIYVPTAGNPVASRGIVGGSRTKGSYVNINHIQVWYSFSIGFSFSQPRSNFNDCTALGTGDDGFMFVGRSGSTPSEMASYCQTNRCLATYCCASIYPGSVAGQAFTTGADHTWFRDSVAHHNWCAGFDALHYDANQTNPCFGGSVYCTSYNNGQAPNQSQMNDPDFYVDGAHDWLTYGCIGYNAGVGGQSGRNAANFVSSSEHATLVPYNIHFVNNLGYNASFYNMYVTKGSAASTYGNTIVNNTLVRGSGGYGGTFSIEGSATAKSTVKNNILYNGASYNALIWISGITSSTVDMDYNCYYDPNKSTIFADGESSPSYTLAQWVTNRGLDTHSIQLDPKLVNTTFATLDAHLTVATSPCINAGVDTPWTPPQWVIDAGVLADNGAVVGSTRPDGVSDSGTLDMGYHYYNPTPTGSLTSTNVQPATLYLNTTNTDVITFTTANALPIDGKIVITYPISLGGGFTFNSGGASTASFNSGGDGSLTVSIVGSVVTLSRSGGTVISAAQAVSINLTKVLNPPQSGSTGAYQIKTTTSADATIDIDTNVSADQIIAPPVSFITITISGISASGIKINTT